MKKETTAGSEKKPVYTKPWLRELHTPGDAGMGNCNTGTVAILNPKKRV